MDNNRVSFSLKLFYYVGSLVSFINKRMGIKKASDKLDFLIILIIFFKPNINQRKISNVLGVDKTTMSRTVTKLTNSGILTKDTSEHNKASSSLSLTKFGDERAKEFIELVHEFNQISTENISNPEVELLYKTFNEMIMNVKENTDTNFFDLI